ncbi:MAG TPA: pyridoxal phosphate-dependent aminotransferase [Rhodothermales bacterium]
MKPLASRAASLSQSDIRAITLMVREAGAINLGQGICDMPVPDPIKSAAHEAIEADRSIYTSYAGIHRLRDVILHKLHEYNGLTQTTADDIVVSAGSTGAFVATVFALLEAGDEAILFEPFYGYHRNILRLTGATVRSVAMRPPDWSIDFDALEATISPRTRLVVVNTPGNPSGKVWTREELERLLDILVRHDLYAVTDEIYEYMVYDGRRHVSLASLPGARERTITISGFSKTYNMTGWRLGYAVAPPALAEKIGLLNDLFYVCAPSPLQYAVADADMPADYPDRLLEDYTRKREMMVEALEAAGLEAPRPQGAYYVLASFEALSKQHAGFENDRAACETLIREARVASIPGSSFFDEPGRGRYLLRFCFAKEFDVLEEACSRLRQLGG